MYIKTDAIVLREIEYKDNDKLLTVLTRDLGKITVKARGAKSTRSKWKAACQLLSFSEMTMLDYQGRYVLTEAVPRELFTELQRDIELLSLASYFAQVTEVVAQENDPNGPMLSLLLNCLYAIAKLRLPQTLVKAGFELRTACLAGFEPDLRGCVVCGNPRPNRFNNTQGALQCATCSAEGTDGIRMPLMPATLAAMQYLATAPAKRLFSFQLAPEALDELAAIAESYLCTRLERGFYTLDFYKSLFL